MCWQSFALYYIIPNYSLHELDKWWEEGETQWIMHSNMTAECPEQIMQPKHIQSALLWITWCSFLMALSHLNNRDQWGDELTEWEMLFQNVHLPWESKAFVPTPVKKLHPARIQDLNILYREINIFYSANFCPRVISFTLGHRINMTL